MNYICVRDVMDVNHFAMVDGTTLVSEVITLAQTENISYFIVNKRDELDEYGFLLLSDIAKKILAEDRSPLRTSVYEIMSKPAFVVEPTMKVTYCARFFSRFGISCAPVVELGQIIGVISYHSMVLKGMMLENRLSKNSDLKEGALDKTVEVPEVHR